MNKAKLLKLIDEDDEIKDAIKNIFSQNNSTQERDNDKEIEMLKGLVTKWKKCFKDEEIKSDTLTQELEQQKSDLTHDIDTLEQEKVNLTNENKQLQSTKKELEESVLKLQSDNKNIESTNTKLHNTVEFYRKNFEEELRIYELFSSLSTKTKESLNGIFKDSSLEGFLSCGVQDKNISSFWEYIKVELQEDKNSDIEKLVQIYNFLFQRYIKAFPIYALQEVNAGDEFEALSHVNHSSSSAVSGTITKVLLRGYVNTKTSKVIKQSVVKVG